MSDINMEEIARTLDMMLGAKGSEEDVPFICAVFNEKTGRVEFCTNMETESMRQFVEDMSEGIREPDWTKAVPRGIAGMQ